MITCLNHYLHGKCDTSLLLFLVMGLMSLKKYCKIWGGVLPPPYTHPPPEAKTQPFSPTAPSFSAFHSYVFAFTFHISSRITPPSHPDISRIHLIPVSTSSIICHHVMSISHTYVSVSCHCVMSSCHVILSCTSLQT